MKGADAIVVGGGPAGMAAAVRLAAAGMAVTVFDEQPRPGGQILRQPPAAFAVADWLPGAPHRPLKAALAAFERSDAIVWRGGASVVDAATDGGFTLAAATADAVIEATAPYLVIATGCYDLPVALPGWTLPGVLSAGAVQAFVKAQRLVPGDRFVLAGTHPLMLVVAAQLVEAGGTVARIAFDQPRAAMLRALARRLPAALAHAGTLAAAAQAMRTLRRYRVQVDHGRPLVAIEGEAGVAAARFADGAVACDRVALCYGFVPQSDLPRLLGAEVEWAAPAGGWRTRHDEWMRTAIPGLSIAGETGGVAGAEVALLEGRLAALGILKDRGADVAREAAGVRRRLAHRRGFAALLDALADPREALARPVSADTILCRCEDVTVGAVADAVAAMPVPDAVKLATRCGMGLCQGRSCEPALLRMIAAARDEEPGGAGGFTVRFPIRPVTIGDLVG